MDRNECVRTRETVKNRNICKAVGKRERERERESERSRGKGERRRGIGDGRVYTLAVESVEEEDSG